MTGQPTPRLAVLRNRDFTFFLAARFLATLAVQMQTVAVGWQVYSVTRDPLDLGLVGLSQFLPFVLLILPAGHVADNHDRRRVLAACFTLEAVCALLLLAFAARGLDSARPVFAVMVLFGVARAFAMPAGQALLPNLVPREQFGTAVALNSSTWQVATIAGPALGGVVYLLGAPVVYASVAVLLAVSVGLLLGLRRGGGHAQPTEPPGWYTLLSGLRFVRSHRPVLGAISLDLFAVLFGGAVALLPVYAKDILQVGTVEYGFLRSAAAVGGAVMALLLTRFPLRRRVGRTLFIAIATFGIGTIVFGLSRNYYLSLAALTVLGAADMISVYVRSNVVPLATPDTMLGRVTAVEMVFIGASNELGAFESGAVAWFIGPVATVVLGGVATLAVCAAWIKLFPPLYRIDRLDRRLSGP
jgi:MFS family permease